MTSTPAIGISRTISFELDGRPVDAAVGESIRRAAARAGVRIPHLCDTDGLRPDGNCRACVVEIDGERTLAPSCCRAPSAGMKVRARSERALAAQRMVLELLLADRPESVRKESSELDTWAAELGVVTSRFPAREQPATDASHPAMLVNLDACIQCTRCVRACREVQVNDVIGYAWRGAQAAIVFDQADPMGESSCVACGECVQVCPTGALMPRQLGGLAPSPMVLSPALPPLDASQPGAVASAMQADRVVDSLCPFCGVGCQLSYHLRDERIEWVSGRDGPANQGRLCVKGRFGFDYAMSPDRLTVPLLRKPGAAKPVAFDQVPANWRDDFREASWAEALDAAATALLDIRERHGPRALAGFGSAKGSNEEAYLFQKLVRTGFGSNNVDHCTRLCHASSVAALLEGLGSGAVSNPVSDVLKADLVFIIGANPTVNHPVAASFIKNAVKAGTRLIIADPRRTELARHASHVLQFRSDTDVALLDAMLHTIIDEGLTDSAFIASRTEDFEALRAVVADCSAEAMAPICGIDAARIREVARLYAGSRAAMILWGMGVSQHTHGTDNVRCLIALAMITGQIGRPGTGLHPLRGQNNVQGASDAGLIPMMLPDYQRVDDATVRARFESRWGQKLDPVAGLTVVEILDAAIQGTVRGMYIMGENPAMSDPDLAHARQALAALDCLVVQDIFPTETAYMADVILPASAFAEKTGSFTNTDRMVQLGRAAIRAPGQARQDLDLIIEMARRFGLDWQYSGPGDVFEEMRSMMPSIAGISWERLQTEGSVTYPCADAQDPGQPVVFVDHFPTQSGRARLVPARPQQAAEQPDAVFPFVLITGRLLEHWHTGSMTRRAQALDAVEPAPVATVNARELARLGAAAGDWIRLSSRRGSIELQLRVDAGLADGSVFVPFAYAEAPANRLTSPSLDPFGKIPGFKYSAVRIERIDPPGD